MYLARSWYRFLTFGFHLLYNQLAWSYDSVSWLVSLGQWRKWQRVALPYLSGHAILELAHGPGHMLLELDRTGYSVVGCDLSPAMGRQARRRLQKAGISLPLVRARAQGLPFVDEAFDGILSTFPAEFIADPKTIGQLYRLLRPGGRLIIVPEARLSSTRPQHRFLELLYTITGQRAAPAEQQGLSSMWVETARRFGGAGFVMKLESVIQKDSQVTVIIAQKPG